ncbi:RNA polymerase sigma-70 factor (ECF subfamily) [Dyadobacter jejuensis]|uniref:RNA polymerase sigma factor n=1 Tax=Dyadobacter jejuensis TaxID=1082580 RepID=A0A316ADT0_9BACT|nr:sigma-70 family RNA polymerase sigma factor [Dyadobacter jejuensis]PWJ55925.1 RNA polymerase sigma-70 factor (ECF subfamily) [Dyadobacter jejuensis]
MNEHFDIIRAIVRKDPKAFDVLYDSFSTKVYNTALSYLQNVEDAEEVTQDVFLKVYQYASKFNEEAAVSTWIYRITVNSSLNFIKKKKRFSFLKFGKTDVELPDFEHPGVLLENKETAQSLFKAIQDLPESQKTAFILGYIEELPRQEIADIMETTLNAVESLLQRAKKNLRVTVKKY